jgi:hypothetical protein
VTTFRLGDAWLLHRFHDTARVIHEWAIQSCEEVVIRWLPRPRWSRPVLDWSEGILQQWRGMDPQLRMPILGARNSLTLRGEGDGREQALAGWFARRTAATLPRSLRTLAAYHSQLAGTWGPDLFQPWPTTNDDPAWWTLSLAAGILCFWTASTEDDLTPEAAAIFPEEMVRSLRGFLSIEGPLRAALSDVEARAPSPGPARDFMNQAAWLDGELGLRLTRLFDMLVRIPSSPCRPQHFATYGGDRVEYFRTVMGELESESGQNWDSPLAWRRRRELSDFYGYWTELVPGNVLELPVVPTTREAFEVFFKPWLHLQRVSYDRAQRTAASAAEEAFRRTHDAVYERCGARLEAIMNRFRGVRGTSRVEVAA